MSKAPQVSVYYRLMSCDSLAAIEANISSKVIDLFDNIVDILNRPCGEIANLIADEIVNYEEN